MFDKIKDLFNLFRKGQAVASKGAWKDGGNYAALLSYFIMAAVKLAGDFGYVIQLTSEEAFTIASGISALILFVVHNISSEHAGILPAKQPAKDVSNNDEQTTNKLQPVSGTANSPAEDTLYRG